MIEMVVKSMDAFPVCNSIQHIASSQEKCNTSRHGQRSINTSKWHRWMGRRDEEVQTPHHIKCYASGHNIAKSLQCMWSIMCMCIATAYAKNGWDWRIYWQQHRSSKSLHRAHRKCIAHEPLQENKTRKATHDITSRSQKPRHDLSTRCACRWERK